MTLDRLVASGIDGALVDVATRDYDPARPAVAALATLGIPLVLCSSRPRADVELVSRIFGLGAPMIVENGAALLLPDGHLPNGVPGGRRDGEHHVLLLGPPRQRLREALVEVAAAARVEVRLVADLPPRGLGSPSGLPAATSLRYEYTEPFLVEPEGDVTALAREAEARGLRLARGERFFFLCGGADKGLALRTLLSLYEREGIRPHAIALGTWPVDLPMLRAAHRPIVLPGAGGRIDPLLAAELKQAERARRAGPAGWNAAVLALLAGHRLPSVSRGHGRDGPGGRPVERRVLLALAPERRPHPPSGRVVKRTTLKLSGTCES